MSLEKHTSFQGHRGLPSQRAQRKPKGPMAQKVPPEEENPRVKCRDCGAFGHTWKSRRCPIKHAYAITVPQGQQGRNEKENRYPGRPQTQENLCQVERDKRLIQGKGQR
ncbi:putative protein FAM90A16P/FAM90A17P isoform X1 [Cricetulus griseus]|uniref:putative protein FAM90A16P/FAM90A17P isoform X1 n=1 Tax=Cricetulus griseus TaxID=10029 RepID=UPI00045491D9|nr:putative protein FAM90A16P/FAM90A17P isoform X1 [Cricetulus griseus]